MIKIAPSILSADFSNLGEAVSSIAPAQGDLVHVDIMDGHFVPNLTIGPMVVKGLRDKSELPFDVHLMINRPEDYMDKFIEAGADYLVIHSETSTHLHRTLTHIKNQQIIRIIDGESRQIKNKYVKAGVALNPSTPISQIVPILEDLDIIVIMTVNPGFSAQKFITSMIPKIEETRKIIDDHGYNIELEVDGGVDINTIPIVVRSGANIAVAGNAAFHGPGGNLAENIKLLKKAAAGK
jgi:ribulose-phosphate 3-epimerase